MANRVLVVEQSAAMRCLIVYVLEANGYAAFGSNSVKDARSIASVDPPDVAIVGVNLRDGSSADLVRFLRELGTPVAAFCSWMTARELFEAGAQCIVGKPVSESELLVALRWLEEVYGSANSGSERPPRHIDAR